MSNFDPLKLYMNWFLEGSILRYSPPVGAISTEKEGSLLSGITGVVLDRQGQFQTELFIVPPLIKEIKMHTHLDVSSIEWAIAGDFVFICEDYQKHFQATGNPIFETSGPIVVKPTASHGASIINDGAVFLSFQYWLNGIKPTSVGYSFE